MAIRAARRLIEADGPPLGEQIQIGPVTLYRGDCLAVLQALPDESVDAVVTDPPYSSGGQFRGDRMGSTRSKYLDADAKVVRPDFDGDCRDQRSWEYWCCLWLAECHRAARPGATILLFTDWRQLPTATDALQAGGWVWRGIVPWLKPGARPQKGRFTAESEFVLWGSKGPMPTPRASDRCLPGAYRVSIKRSERFHQTSKPVSLLTQLLEIVPAGGTVLDPFFGGGTTGVACLQTGRRCIGIERNQAYYQIARERVTSALAEHVPTPEES